MMDRLIKQQSNHCYTEYSFLVAASSVVCVCVIRASVKVQSRPNLVVLANRGRFGLEPGFQA